MKDKNEGGFHPAARPIHLLAAAICVVCVLLLHTPVLAQSVTIDQAWLSARAPSPYYLDQPAEPYII